MVMYALIDPSEAACIGVFVSLEALRLTFKVFLVCLSLSIHHQKLTEDATTL